ncbi:hypothetical protein QFC20_003237 [Naganishia adeliensis]|uniref:Uncharacterized protein n=1 Tax=Naganishia adeliensis TaxID=92952 RepID=A0ACC2WEI0_9TREE|nr:hypothetical protein QFC20_003237 [Naganishia adeliensis]
MSNASSSSTSPTPLAVPPELREEADASRTSASSSASESDSYEESPYIDNRKAPVITSLDDVAERIKSAKNVILMVGAGVSVSAGIPDFRSPDTGLYANLQRFNLPAPEAIFDLSFFKAKPEPFFMLCKDLYPVDTLEVTSGLPEDLIVEAHGSFAKSHCLGCRRETPHEEMLERVREGKVVRCKECNNLVKPDIVFFGEGLPGRFFQMMRTDLPKCDLLIVIGTSLQVHPFASLIDYVADDCPRVLINKERVGEAHHRWDDGFRFEDKTRDFFWQGEADVGIAKLAEKLGWKDELDQLVSSHQSELKKKWNIPLDEARESGVDEAEDVLAKLAEDLRKVGLVDEDTESQSDRDKVNQVKPGKVQSDNVKSDL